MVDTGSGWTPLMRVSAVTGSQKVASLLIEAGADVNVKDKDGKTPLMVPPCVQFSDFVTTRAGLELSNLYLSPGTGIIVSTIH